MQTCHKPIQNEAACVRSSDATLNAIAPLKLVNAPGPAAHGTSETKCKDCLVSRERDELMLKLFAFYEAADKRLANLTHRQHEVMTMVLAGHQSKNIAADLQISQRTVENHRASIMKRTGARSLPELARLAFAACWSTPSTARFRGTEGAEGDASVRRLQS